MKEYIELRNGLLRDHPTLRPVRMIERLLVFERAVRADERQRLSKETPAPVGTHLTDKVNTFTQGTTMDDTRPQSVTRAEFDKLGQQVLQMARTVSEMDEGHRRINSDFAFRTYLFDQKLEQYRKHTYDGLEAVRECLEHHKLI